MTTQATNAKGQTIKFSDVQGYVENYEVSDEYPDGFAEWLDSINRTEGLTRWLENGDFDTAESAETVAGEWMDVLLDAFYTQN